VVDGPHPEQPSSTYCTDGQYRAGAEQPSEAHLEGRLSDSTLKLGWVFGWVWVAGWAAAIVVALLLYRFVW
jgi:hypothetical protein